MGFYFVRCCEYVDGEECTVAVGADTLEEVIEAAIEHAHVTHAEEDTPALRQTIRESIREGSVEPAAS